MTKEPNTQQPFREIRDKKTAPLVSVIMPIRNEARYIERTLNAVLTQDYPPDRLEILIADGLSTDGTRAIIQTLITNTQYPIPDTQLPPKPPQNKTQKSQPTIHLLDNPNKIVPTALNLALQHATGEIIIRVDGHCEIAPDYIRRCVEHLQTNDVAGVGGPIETVGETTIAKTIAIAMSSPFGVGGSPFRTIDDRAMLVDSVAFPAYKRETIEKAGPFDEELVRNQDDEYNYRVRKLGGKILLSPDIRSRYYSRASLGKLWKQYYQYGYWKVRVLQKHPRQMRPRQFVPPLFVLALLGSLALAALSFASRKQHYAFRILHLTPIAWLLIIYLLANLAATIFTSAKSGWRHVFLLPIVFIILHISYGLGFLVGLVSFIHRWGDKQGSVPDFELGDTIPDG